MQAGPQVVGEGHEIRGQFGEIQERRGLGLWARRKSQSCAKALAARTDWMVVGHWGGQNFFVGVGDEPEFEVEPEVSAGWLSGCACRPAGHVERTSGRERVSEQQD